ncbi:hypothetical protein AQI88_37685 [Streptomyces cellostaticus]|uniref:Uncharacterized protein n=1 Tax=Streptomyces cellostaticus TaxID=67285 RepID=A0A101NDT6_9ACTN|nr:hypothetical protein [Streptomyces cellostaticus]KUM91261.1 hypothetical protein AQI88_37685 [Streptomyces cellostaticus]GHI09454.1 hypothetical protein Scel_77750 [Streptomyces cellostaticus]
MHHSPFHRPDPRFVPAGEHPLWDVALAAVNRDLAVTLPEQRPLCLMALPPWEDGEPEQVHVALADGQWHGNSLWAGPRTAADALAAVAEAAQDTVTERLWQAWPICSVHDLGMHVRKVSGRPSWWCAGAATPGDPPHIRAAIGELDTLQRPHRPNRKRRKKRAQG